MELNITEFIKKETNLKDGNKLQEFTERELNILIYKALKEQLILSGVSKSLVADIRNKLSSPENLCAMLKDREVEPFIGNDERNQMIDAEIKQTLKSIEYLSNL
jgi:hypothetical protein